MPLGKLRYNILTVNGVCVCVCLRMHVDVKSCMSRGVAQFGDSLGAAAQILTVSFGSQPGENDGNWPPAK